MIKPRPIRLFRVVVDTAPDGPVPLLVKGYDGKWEQPTIDWDYGSEVVEDLTRWYVVGQSRTFHSLAVARRKAELWEAHGCTTHIDRSKPVEWEIPS